MLAAIAVEGGDHRSSCRCFLCESRIVVNGLITRGHPSRKLAGYREGFEDSDTHRGEKENAKKTPAEHPQDPLHVLPLPYSAHRPLDEHKRLNPDVVSVCYQNPRDQATVCRVQRSLAARRFINFGEKLTRSTTLKVGVEQSRLAWPEIKLSHLRTAAYFARGAGCAAQGCGSQLPLLPFDVHYEAAAGA